MSAAFVLRQAGMRYGGAEVLHDITLEFRAACLTAIVGANGAGKSTLVNVLAGVRSTYSGSCRLDGIEVRDWPRKRFASRVSFVPQTVQTEFPFSAEQVVLMGRLPHATGIFEREEDFAAARRAMELTGTAQFRDRDFRSLSGGERQRVILAAALAQETEAIVLDEPTTFLDVGHQVSLYRILRDEARAGKLVITVTHDLNLAAAFAGRVVMLRSGEVAADGDPAAVLTEAALRAAFGVEARVVPSPAPGRPWIHYGY